MITEHLDACLTGDNRVKHKLYNASKVQLIFKALLDDTGTTLKIQDLIKDINSIARRRVDEEEREQRRVAANKEREASLESVAETTQQDDTDEEPMIRAKVEPGEFDGEPIVIQDGEKKESKKKAQKKRDIANSKLKNIYEDEDQIYSLKDLISTDFDMPITDKDFKLTHEQLVRASKILLHKVNYMNKKNKYEHEQAVLKIQKQYEDTEMNVNSSLVEAKHFIDNVHKDFEKFLIRNKKETSDMNIKYAKLNELSSKTFDSIDKVRDSVTSFATILACQLEFNSIQ